MILRGIDFGSVWGASGVQGFFGEGYWFHRILERLGPLRLDFRGMTFTGKTTTLESRLEPEKQKGNMPLEDDFTPREYFPKCIVVKFLKGVALNAVGLSGPGAVALLKTGRWQARRKPFFISFMSVEKNVSDRLKEFERFAALLPVYLQAFRGKVGLQINFSCPNVGLHAEELIGEVKEVLDITGAIPQCVAIVPKFNVLLHPAVAAEIAEHPLCDGLCITNTILWGQLPDRIDWKGLFGSDVSPLAHLGGGGLSGKPLLPLLLEWLAGAQEAGVSKPINAGGGILSLRDAKKVRKAGADSISLGSIAFLRWWRVKRIIAAMNGRGR